MVGNVHYAPINDLSWHYSNERLVACSSDGYCSILNFASAPAESNLIGKRLANEEIEDETVRQTMIKSDCVNFKMMESQVSQQKRT